MLQLSSTITYPLLFLLSIPEGPLLGVFAGFLIRHSALLLLPTYGVLLLGNVVPDLVCYGLGHYGSKKSFVEKYGKRFAFVQKHFPLMERLWKEHFKKTIILSKLAYALSTPFLVSAGLFRVPFKKYISHTIVIDLFAIAAFLALGYIFGEAYALIAQYIDYAGMLIAALFLCFILVYRFIAKRARDELVNLEE